MWNEQWQPLIEEGKLQVLGIVQEQHGERTKLYKQWKQYEWPIVQDALNLLEVKVVPLVIALDEEGTVVSHRADKTFLNQWLNSDKQVEAASLEAISSPFDQARAEFFRPEGAGLDKSIEHYETLVQAEQKGNAKGHFELAVCYRNRFERDGSPDDFQKAIDHWSTALEIDPNQYIYRRRIEQYGARLGKPYPFYDWVETATSEIQERGDEPVALEVPISGAEIAQPIRKFETTRPMKKDMDWETAKAIQNDDSELMLARAVAVPAMVSRGQAVRVHVLVSPGQNAKWNNEAGPTALVLQPNEENLKFSTENYQLELPDQAESAETRRFEFEVFVDENADDVVWVRGAVLINVCMIDSGVCTFLRKPFELKIQVKKE